MADWAKETKGNPMPSRFFDFTLQQAMEGEQSGLNRLFGEKSSNWANKMVVIKEMTLGDMA